MSMGDLFCAAILVELDKEAVSQVGVQVQARPLRAQTRREWRSFQVSIENTDASTA